jgi:hypothetical protein
MRNERSVMMMYASRPMELSEVIPSQSATRDKTGRGMMFLSAVCANRSIELCMSRRFALIKRQESSQTQQIVVYKNKVKKKKEKEKTVRCSDFYITNIPRKLSLIPAIRLGHKLILQRFVTHLRIC